MFVEKEHQGRYTLRAADRTLIGQLMQSQHGWMYRDAKGFGPRRPEPSPARALVVACIIGHLKPESMRAPWGELIAQADRAFSHNQKVSHNA